MVEAKPGKRNLSIDTKDNPGQNAEDLCDKLDGPDGIEFHE